MLATPDLIVNQFRLEGNVAVQTRTFSSNDCAVVEGCALAGSRRLLLFDVGLINAGDGDLVIGDPAQRPDLFHISPCHGHYHMDGVAAYELLSTNGQTVITVRKQGFCFRDQHAIMTNAVEGKFTCENQGLSIGWEDVYDKSLDCQWLDITGLAAGDYILRVVCNPDAVLHESNFQNNVAEVLITLAGAPPTQTNKPPKCINHDDWKKWWDWKKLKNKFKGQWVKKCKIPRCTCKCHTPPGKPGNGNGSSDGDDDDDHGNGGNGGGGKDDDDHGGNGGNGGGNGGKDDDDDHGGNGGGKDEDDDHDGGKGGDDDDDHGGNNGGKDGDDDDDHGGKGGGKDDDDDYGNNGKGKGGKKDDGKDKGKGKGDGKGKSNGKGKPAKPAPKAKTKK